MKNKKNSIVRAEDAKYKHVLEKILGGSKRKLVVSVKNLVDRKIVEENKGDCFISMKSRGKRFGNQEFYELPPSLPEISLMVSDKLIFGEYKYLILDDFEYLLTFYDVPILEKFIAFLIRSSNEMGASVVGVFEDNEQSSRLVPFLIKHFDI